MTIRNLDALFRPQRVWFLGAPQTTGQAAALADRITRGGAGVDFQQIEGELPASNGADTPMLAVLADPRYATAQCVHDLGARGCRALLWPQWEPPGAEVLAAARPHMLRILGPRSVGLVNTAIGLDVSLLAQTPGTGQVALIVQSQSVAAAAVDWAIGRRIGFSWIAVTGGEADVDVADLLDYAALDADTHAVAVEVGRIRGGRKFMSAARACARAKPTVILQTRRADATAAGADPVRSAAFARAGLVEVPALPALFDALAALQQLPPMEQRRVLVVANGAALCALSIDAVLRQQLALADLDESARRTVLSVLPGARFRPGAIDIGEPAIDRTVEVLRGLLGTRGIDAVLFVRSPVAGHPHEPISRALVEAGIPPRLLTVWLGLESVLPARRLAAESGLPTFTSPDAAARALRYRHEYARNRELLTQTPPAHALPTLDAAAIAVELRASSAAHDEPIDAPSAARLFRAYDMHLDGAGTPACLELRVFAALHPELGMHLGVQARVPGLQTTTAHAFAPLDALTASRLLADGGLQLNPAQLASVSAELIRMAQMLMDQPAIAQVEARLALDPKEARWLPGPQVRLTASPVADRQRLALAPYPARIAHAVRLRDGLDYALRPVQPSDEPAVVGLLQSLDPESVRLRFFAYIRHFSHPMAARITQIDYDRELGLVVHRLDAGADIVGLATLVLDPDESSGEFALLVHPACARLGLGRHLLQTLIDHGRARGVNRIWGEILAENWPMRDLARRCGFSLQRDPRDPTCTIATLVHATPPPRPAAAGLLPGG